MFWTPELIILLATKGIEFVQRRRAAQNNTQTDGDLIRDGIANNDAAETILLDLIAKGNLQPPTVAEIQAAFAIDAPLAQAKTATGAQYLVSTLVGVRDLHDARRSPTKEDVEAELRAYFAQCGEIGIKVNGLHFGMRLAKDGTLVITDAP